MSDTPTPNDDRQMKSILERMHATPFIVMVKVGGDQEDPTTGVWFRHSEYVKQKDAMNMATLLAHTLERLVPRIGIRLTDDDGKDVVAFSDWKGKVIRYTNLHPIPGNILDVIEEDVEESGSRSKIIIAH